MQQGKEEDSWAQRFGSGASGLKYPKLGCLRAQVPEVRCLPAQALARLSPPIPAQLWGAQVLPRAGGPGTPIHGSGTPSHCPPGRPGPAHLPEEPGAAWHRLSSPAVSTRGPWGASGGRIQGPQRAGAPGVGSAEGREGVAGRGHGTPSSNGKGAPLLIPVLPGSIFIVSLLGPCQAALRLCAQG